MANWRHDIPWRATTKGRCHPAFVVNRTVTKHFKILCAVLTLCRRIVKTVDEALAVHRELLDPGHPLGGFQIEDLQDGRHDVVYMRPLVAQLTLAANAIGPTHNERVACTPKMRGHGLGPLEGCVGRPCPSCWKVGKRICSAKRVEAGYVLCDVFGHSHQTGEVVPSAVEAPFGARAVVAHHVDEQRIVELVDFAKRSDKLAHLRIGVGKEAGVDLHQSTRDFALIFAERFPCGNFRRTRSQDRVVWNGSGLALPGERLPALFVPAMVEPAFEAFDPFFGGVQWGVGCTRSEVDEEWFFRTHRLLRLHPDGCALGDVFADVIVGPVGTLHRSNALIESRFKLMGLATQESVEGIEADASRPTLEGPRRRRLPIRSQMPLPPGGSRIALVAKHRRNRRSTLFQYAFAPQMRGS